MKKSFLITGSTKGIGLALAHYLSQLKYHVIGIARHQPIESFPGSLYLADLSNREETHHVLQTIQQNYVVNGIINNIGHVLPQTIEELSLENFQDVMDLNIRPAIQAMQCFLPHMKKQQWGRVVNVASRALLGKVGRSSYSAAQFSCTDTHMGFGIGPNRDYCKCCRARAYCH